MQGIVIKLCIFHYAGISTTTIFSMQCGEANYYISTDVLYMNEILTATCAQVPKSPKLISHMLFHFNQIHFKKYYIFITNTTL